MGDGSETDDFTHNGIPDLQIRFSFMQYFSCRSWNQSTGPAPERGPARQHHQGRFFQELAETASAAVREKPGIDALFLCRSVTLKAKEIYEKMKER